MQFYDCNPKHTIWLSVSFEDLHINFFYIIFPFLKTAYNFQENLLRTMIQIENTYFELGESCKKNCLIICDRGVMDASACEYTVWIINGTDSSI